MKKQKINFGSALFGVFLLLNLLSCQPIPSPKEASSSLYAVNVDNKWGFIDTFGNVVVKPQYLQEGYYYGDRLVVRDDTSSLIIDRKGKTIFRISNSSMPIKFNGKWFKIDEFGDSIRFYNDDAQKQFSISHVGIFDVHTDFDASNRALVVFNDTKKYGYLNKSGKMVLTITDGIANSFDGETDLAAVEFENKTCYIDTMGKSKFCVTGKGERFVSGYAIVRDGNAKYFINPFGKKVLDVSKYSDVFPFIDGVALVISEKRGRRLINLKGEDFLPAKYKNLDYPVRGVLPAEINVGGKSKYVLINLRGEKVLDQEYDAMYFWGDGNLIGVRLGEKTGLINHRGQFVWVDPPKK